MEMSDDDLVEAPEEVDKVLNALPRMMVVPSGWARDKVTGDPLVTLLVFGGTGETVEEEEPPMVGIGNISVEGAFRMATLLMRYAGEAMEDEKS